MHKAIDDDPWIARALKEQFDRLIFQPLTNIGSTQARSSILVIDALDECDRDHVRITLSLLHHQCYTESNYSSHGHDTNA